MATLEFHDFAFFEKEDKVRVTFLKGYYFDIPKEDLEKIAKFKTDKNTIEFDTKKEKANNKFKRIISKYFGELKSVINNNPTIYVHQNSGIPLFGNHMFGIVDKGTNIIELKPNTGCNMACTFCSVDEGAPSKKIREFVVEKDYLVSELRKLIDFKGTKHLTIYINVHGEPLLYSPIKELIKDISASKEVDIITLITNGTLLTPNIVDELVDAGLDQMSVSVSGYEPELSKELMGSSAYDAKRVRDVLTYAAKRLKLMITPVWLSGKNDEEIDKIVGFAKEIGAGLGIQNFLHNQRGRNPVKEISFEEFYEKLKFLEEKYDIDLKQGPNDFFKTKEMERPFKKGEVITAEIMCKSRFKNEVIAVAKDRNIIVMKCFKDKGNVKVKLTKDAHNMFVGV